LHRKYHIYVDKIVSVHLKFAINNNEISIMVESTREMKNVLIKIGSFKRSNLIPEEHLKRTLDFLETKPKSLIFDANCGEETFIVS